MGMHNYSWKLKNVDKKWEYLFKKSLLYLDSKEITHEIKNDSTNFIIMWWDFKMYAYK